MKVSWCNRWCFICFVEQGPSEGSGEKINGHVRKRQPWVSSLHRDLHEELDRLGRLEVKFYLSTLRHLPREILRCSEIDAYRMNMVDARSEQPFHTKITLRWIQSFTER